MKKLPTQKLDLAVGLRLPRSSILRWADKSRHALITGI